MTKIKDKITTNKQKEDKAKSVYNSVYYVTKGKQKYIMGKLQKEQIKLFTLTPEYWNPTIKYRNNLTDYFSKWDYTHYFTLTFNPRFKSVYRKKKNKEIREYNNSLPDGYKDLELPVLQAYFGITKLKSLVEPLLNKMIRDKVIDRAIVFYEECASGDYHCHVTINLTNDLYLPSNLESLWIFGRSHCKPIESEEHKRNCIWYSTKELKPNSIKINDLNKTMHWIALGDYSIESQFTDNEVYKYVKKERKLIPLASLSELIDNKIVISKVRAKRTITNKISKPNIKEKTLQYDYYDGTGQIRLF